MRYYKVLYQIAILLTLAHRLEITIKIYCSPFAVSLLIYIILKRNEMGKYLYKCKLNYHYFRYPGFWVKHFQTEIFHKYVVVKPTPYQKR